MPKIIFKEKGLTDYSQAYYFQEKIFNSKIKEKREGKIPENNIFWYEHPHVYTLGNSGNKNNLLVNDEFLRKIKATYFKSNRGGDITYHGPGQIVAYPIIDIEQFNIGVNDYIYILETAVIELLKDYKIYGQIKKGAAGVWLDTGKSEERKICAIGVKISRGITMHGFALNVNTDLSYFKNINPCGFTDKTATSLQKEKGQKIILADIKIRLESILPSLLNKNFIKKTFV